MAARRHLLLLASFGLLQRSAVSAQDGPVAAQEGPYDHVALQLLEEECPVGSSDPPTAAAWQRPLVAGLEALGHMSSNFGTQHLAAALSYFLLALYELLEQQLALAFKCPALGCQQLKQAADWSLALNQPRRARVLVQLGHAFKFQALKEFTNRFHEIKEAFGGEVPSTAQLDSLGEQAPPKRFLPRLHVEYQIMLGQLHEKLQVQPLPWQRAAATGGPRIEIHSICSYKPDPTSKTGLHSPLLQMSVPNHQAYAARHGYRYVVHTESALPDREAHYSKMYVVYRRFEGAQPTWAQHATAPEGPQLPEWIFYIDCDAYFTEHSMSLGDLLHTYAAPAGAEDVQFLVAEDPGGINTGVFAIRRSEWSMRFLERVVRSSFTVAWDQSMFFWDMARGALDMDLSEFASDFSYPPQVRLVHQAQFNAFVPPASTDWMAHEWQPGDFVRHFAGCPWQEPRCLQMMQETTLWAHLPLEDQRRAVQ